MTERWMKPLIIVSLVMLLSGVGTQIVFELKDSSAWGLLGILSGMFYGVYVGITATCLFSWLWGDTDKGNP